MEEFIEKYSKWFPYCEKDKLEEEMRKDLSAITEPEVNDWLLYNSENNEVFKRYSREGTLMFRYECGVEEPWPHEDNPCRKITHFKHV